jgi:hypothetical protein
LRVSVCDRTGKSGPLYERLKRYLEAKKLKLNETKTRVVDSRREKFSFPGFELSNRGSVRKGTRYVHVEAAKKARRQLRETIRRELNRWTIHESCAQALRTVNAIVRRWTNYYLLGTLHAGVQSGAKLGEAEAAKLAVAQVWKRACEV